jgi:hypothetical protein
LTIVLSRFTAFGGASFSGPFAIIVSLLYNPIINLNEVRVDAKVKILK